MIREILEEALNEVNSIKQNVPKDVQEASFLAALDGISKGQMDYQKDIVLDKVQKKVEAKVQKFQNLSQAEIKKLISLSKE